MTLDFFFSRDTTLYRASEPFIAKATWFIDGRIDVFMEENIDIDEQRKFEWVRQRSMRIKIWACALECGIECIERGVTLRSFPYPELSQALRTCFSNDTKQHSFKKLYNQYREQYDLITDVTEGMTELYFRAEDPTYLPAWIKVGPSEADKILIMCPNRDSYAIAIPALLLHEDYVNCKRIFFLVVVSDTTESWKILGKATGFGANAMVLEDHGVLRESQRILG